MTIKEMDCLHWEILKFLWSIPMPKNRIHPYRIRHIRGIQENILESIATDQFILLRDECNNIKHFLAYWKVDKADIEAIKDGCKPVQRRAGNAVYISEYGSLCGRDALTSMIQMVRQRNPEMEQVCWHNFGRKTFRTFPVKG